MSDVIAMFSTDTNIIPSSFNSKPNPRGYNFAILGEDVIFHADDGSEPLSGTSFATAIGAGIAARILDFSRHPDSCQWLQRVDGLKRTEDMSAIFAYMAKDGEESGYHCMRPWKLLDGLSDSEDGAQSMEEMRKVVCQTISRTLRGKERSL
ncbi:hypothetical protein QBC36DRAFT_372900 [Triangularia setosa]|uniref:Peptidase S8/S53 domain-containing protein n=1 Tax=Triangularia setosa TaxID=2587417 RepID=A0AAN6W835_9PEZI|nr:hypothetical protein QBC36DRAFT_372900 [Podospora setosa]